MCVHASRSGGRPARVRQIASLRAELVLRRARSSSGGMMPNVMFDGSIVRRVGVRHVVRQRADRGRARRRRRRLGPRRAPLRSGPRSAPTRPTRRSLRRPTSGPAKNSDGRARTCHVSASTVGPVDVGVAVHHAEAHELRVLEAGNQAQHALLLAPLDLRLEADQAVVIAGEVVLPQLHGRVRRRGRCADRRRPTGFIGPKRSVSAPRCAMTSIGRQPSKNSLLVEVVDRRRLGVDAARRRTARTPRASSGSSGSRPRRRRRRRPARDDVAGCRRRRSRCSSRPRRMSRSQRDCRNTFVAIDRLGEHDRTDRVVEIQMLLRRPAARRSADSASEVSGPVARITGSRSVDVRNRRRLRRGRS